MKAIHAVTLQPFVFFTPVKGISEMVTFERQKREPPFAMLTTVVNGCVLRGLRRSSVFIPALFLPLGRYEGSSEVIGELICLVYIALSLFY